VPKHECTAEFKEHAVRHVEAVSFVAAARELGLEQPLRNSHRYSFSNL
jgi:transposase-like protein